MQSYLRKVLPAIIEGPHLRGRLFKCLYSASYTYMSTRNFALGSYKYTKDHEWIALNEKNEGVVGITNHSERFLGTIVYVELADVGSKVGNGGK